MKAGERAGWVTSHPGLGDTAVERRAQYAGDGLARHAIQAGHIPGAVNIVSLDGTDGQSQKGRSDKVLAEM
jgi:3-mercaptopyruvate sulfurtransferase SseA